MRRPPFALLFPLLAAGSMLACGRTAAPPVSEETSRPPARQEAIRAELRGAADRLAESLRSHLVEALESGGPEEAVGVCSELAPSLAAEISTAELTVGRISFRTRNPNNAPKERERAWLARLAEQHAAGIEVGELFVPFESDGREGLAYLRPIRIGAPCLACHGQPEQIAPAVRDLLSELYPEDQATGYSVGELRGAFVASFLPQS